MLSAAQSESSLSRVERELGDWCEPGALAWVLCALDADEFEELPSGLREHVVQRLGRSRAVHVCPGCRTISLWVFVAGLEHCRACGESLTRAPVSRAVDRWRGRSPRVARLLDTKPLDAVWNTAPLRLSQPVVLFADSAFVPPSRETQAEQERQAVDRLRQALEELEASPVDADERKRLSKDPGAKAVSQALGDPASPEVAAGSKHLKRGRVDEALAAFSEAIRKNPLHPQPWTKRGIARAYTGDLAGAVQDYSEALVVDEVYLPAWANRASAEFHRGNLEATVHDASRALDLAPQLAQAWLFRGIARAKLGEARQAEDDLFRFLELSPYSPYVRLIRNTLREVEARVAKAG